MDDNSISNLVNYIREARELSILGTYKKSLTIYKTIFEIIDKRINEVQNNNEIAQKWKETKQKLKYENSLIIQIYQNCKNFQNNEEIEEMKKEGKELYYNNFMLGEKINKCRISINKEEGCKNNEFTKNVDFYKKIPYNYIKGKEENKKKNNIISKRINIPNSFKNKSKYYADGINNNRNNKTNVNINYLNNFYQDRDIWTSPVDDPRFPYQKINLNNKEIKRRSLNNKKKEKTDLGVVNIINLEKRRKKYERPWQISNDKSKNNSYTFKNNKSAKNIFIHKRKISIKGNNNNNKINNKINKDKGPPKSPFLLFRYPENDGNGPDTHLIEMIEREVVDKNPNVSFNDIAELDNAKRALIEAVVLPLLMPDFFVGLRRPWKGVLLYGPSGTGKTLLAKALATQGKTTFFNVSPTTFASKWKGESEKLVRILFEMARFYSPSTIFIDEIDSIGTKRDKNEHEASKKMLAEMLVQIDGISEYNDVFEEETGKKQKFVMVLGATNLPWDLDDALRRRFEKRIYIPLPNPVGRRQMFEINFKGIKLSSDVDIETLIKKTEGYSGHDISSVCREASLMNMRRKLMSTNGKFDISQAANNTLFLKDLEAPITQNDILTAIKNISKSVNYNDIHKFEEWTYLYSSK